MPLLSPAPFHAIYSRPSNVANDGPKLWTPVPTPNTFCGRSEERRALHCPAALSGGRDCVAPLSGAVVRMTVAAAATMKQLTLYLGMGRESTRRIDRNRPGGGDPGDYEGEPRSGTGPMRAGAAPLANVLRTGTAMTRLRPQNHAGA